MKSRGVTYLEIVAVCIIIGVLTTIAINSYNVSAEKGKAAEVYPIFADFRSGYQQRRLDRQCVAVACGWNPDIGSGSNVQWRTLSMENPNRAINRFFAYDFWDAPWSAVNAPVSAARNVIIAFRRRVHASYTASINNARWIYMDLDTGEIFRSSHY